MYALALLLVVIGLTLQADMSKAEREHAAALELLCDAEGLHVRQGLVEARPDGVLIRFQHGAGSWAMTWEGATGVWTSSGSAKTAEMAWPIPPGRTRVQCLPRDVSALVDPYHEARWWADVEVTDPAGHYVSPASVCSSMRAAAWHGRAVAETDERGVVWEALGLLDVHRRQGDELVLLGYRYGTPRHWGLSRDGEVVAAVTMRLTAEGVAPHTVSACADPPAGQLSIS